jgi:hypothetical protein
LSFGEKILTACTAAVCGCTHTAPTAGGVSGDA